MNILKIDYERKNLPINFKSTRASVKAIEQLAKNNAYSLTEPNQRLIINAIDKISKTIGKENINFLLRTAANSTYTTSIELEDKPKNDWKTLLINAAKSILDKTPLKDKSKYLTEIMNLEKHKKLNSVEKDIMTLRNKLLKAVDQEQVKKETSGSIKDFKKNLDYFIVSSETTKAHKKYVLDKLNYLMSDKYEINEQLKDKKSIVAAEIINDIAIAAPGNTIPNIKAVDQKSHGICVAISIVRKKLAYEDKPNYIDSLLSELDNRDSIRVYDRTCLGSGKKVDLPKTKVDFNAALTQGYRIIDASATQWMQASTSNGYSLTSYSVYTPFDKDNFGVNRDVFHNVQFADENLKNIQVYYQALLKMKHLLENYKANKIKAEFLNEKKDLKEQDTLKTIAETNNVLRKKIFEITQINDFGKTNSLLKEILNLRKASSGKINKDNKFEYISNEETSVKMNKIRDFILDKCPNAETNPESIKKIYEMVEFAHELIDSTSENKSFRTNYKKLYEIAAALRYLHLKGVENKSFLKNLASDYNVKQDESLISDTIDEYIKIINKNGKNSEIISEQIAKNFGLKSNDKNTVTKHLNDIKSDINNILDEKINVLYDAINLGSKEEVFASYLDTFIEEIAEGKDSGLNSMVSKALQVKNSPAVLIEELTMRKNKILNGDKELFNETYKGLGSGSQTDTLKEYYDYFIQSLQGENGMALLENFIIKHNIDIENNPYSLSEKINGIKNEIVLIEEYLNNISEMLKIRDNNENILYSPDLKDIVIKELETRNIIASKDELQSLQKHFEMIATAGSVSKKKKKELIKFTDAEKNILDRTEQDLNLLYRQIKNELVETRAAIKEPLESLNRAVGVNEGHNYVWEGHSGLFDEQGIHILEYITGRPHHIVDDIDEVVKSIKTTPYSSISSSHVSHEEMSLHSQYVVDVAPVKVKNENGEEIKDALFHDNTWGAAEKDNTWVDSQGLTRSDYSVSYGGQKGYLVNDKYQNGNLVENLLTDVVNTEKEEVIDNKVYKKIRPKEGQYTTPRYRLFLSDGKSLEAEDAANRILKLLYAPSTLFMKNMEKHLKGLSEKEITSLIKQKNVNSNSYLNKYNLMLKKIEDLNIKTKDDYEKLPDNDLIKVTLEKIALKDNYNLSDKDYQISKINNLKDLKTFKKLQEERAVEDLKYAFNKNPKIIQYLLSEIQNTAEKTIVNILKKYGHSEEEFFNIKNVYKVNNKNFNGQLHNITEGVVQSIVDNIEKSINDKDALYEIKKYLNKFTYNKLIFKTTDIENPELEDIINFIDEKFNPNTDEELVNIYNKIQEMDIKEFKSKILTQTTKEDLWIGKKSGYDVFNEIRSGNDNSLNALFNEIVTQDYYINNPEKKVITSNIYNAHTLHKTFLTKYDFDNVYTKMKNDLSILTLPKLYNKYKDRNINGSNAYPAYPMVDYMPEWAYKKTYDEFLMILNNSIDAIKNAKNTKECYEIADKLKKYEQKFDDNYTLTDSQYKAIRRLSKDFLNTFGDTDLQSEAARSALEILDIPQELSFSVFRNPINKIVKRMQHYKKNYTEESIQKDISMHKENIAKACKSFVNSYVQERYHNKVTGALNNYKQALIKESDNIDTAENEFWEVYKKYHLLNNPTTALNTYLKSLAEDSPLHDDTDAIAILMQRALSYSTLANLQAIIMDSIDKGNENIIKSYLADGQLKLTNDTYISIDTPQKVFDVARYLVLDYNIETALYFIDKLGLNEKFIDGLVNDFNFDDFKKIIENYAAEEKKINGIMSEIDNLFNNAKISIQSGDSVYKVLSALKTEIKQIGIAYSLEKSAVRNLIKSINNYHKLIKINKMEQPAKMFETFASDAQNAFIAEISENINQYKGEFANVSTIIQFANSVSLREDSKSMKKLEEFNSNIKKMNDYKNSLLNLQA